MRERVEKELQYLEIDRQDLVNEQISADLTIGMRIDVVDDKIEGLKKKLIEFEKLQTTLNTSKENSQHVKSEGKKD